MSTFGKRTEGPVSRRTAARRPVGLVGSVLTIHGCNSVLVEDLCAGGARLLGRHLPKPGDEVLLRTGEFEALGRIGWADGDYRGVAFDEGEGPSAGTCLALQLRRAA